MPEMSRKEAANRLELCNPNQYIPSDCQGPETDKDEDAHKMGAAALRELDELERWAEACLSSMEKLHLEAMDSENKEKAAWYSGITHSYRLFLKALHGDRQWPEKKEGGE